MDVALTSASHGSLRFFGCPYPGPMTIDKRVDDQPDGLKSSGRQKAQAKTKSLDATGRPPQEEAKRDHVQRAVSTQSLTARGDETATKAGAKALVLVPVLSRAQTEASTAPMARGRRTTAVAHNSGAKLEEAVGLAEAIGLDVVSALIVPIPNPKAGTLFGSGKQDQLADMVQDLDIELVIIDHAVTPVQQRNLEKAWQAKVMDRTGLILEIFGARARTREGRLQVELAHLSYQNGRLVRAWTHLERQRGGGGFLGGPGEAQIELDRRMLQSRIDAIRKELQQVIQTRELHRAGRRKVPYPIVALVGYTNAGKSTLFNALTGADVHAEDQVFATLDPTMREVRLPSGRKIILSDTVGFISELPTTLVAAFKATLEEVIEADLILHVRDIAHDETDAQAADVISILEELDVDTSAGSELIIEAWNKIDLLDEARRNERSLAASKLEGNAAPAILSATTGEGIPALLDRIDARLGRSDVYAYVTVPAGDGKLWHWLHEHADIIDREELETGDSRFQVRMASDTRGRLESQFNVTLSDARPAA